MLSRWAFFVVLFWVFPPSCTPGSVIAGEIWQSWAAWNVPVVPEITQRSHPSLPGQAYLPLAPLLMGPLLWWILLFLLQIHWRICRKVSCLPFFQQDKVSSMTLIKTQLFPFKECAFFLTFAATVPFPVNADRFCAQELEVGDVLKGRTASPLDTWWKEEINKRDPWSMPCISVSVGIFFLFFLYALLFYKVNSITNEEDLVTEELKV